MYRHAIAHGNPGQSRISRPTVETRGVDWKWIALPFGNSRKSAKPPSAKESKMRINPSFELKSGKVQSLPFFPSLGGFRLCEKTPAC